MVLSSRAFPVYLFAIFRCVDASDARSAVQTGNDYPELEKPKIIVTLRNPVFSSTKELITVPPDPSSHLEIGVSTEESNLQVNQGVATEESNLLDGVSKEKQSKKERKEGDKKKKQHEAVKQSNEEGEKQSKKEEQVVKEDKKTQLQKETKEATEQKENQVEEYVQKQSLEKESIQGGEKQSTQQTIKQGEDQTTQKNTKADPLGFEAGDIQTGLSGQRGPAGGEWYGESDVEPTTGLESADQKSVDYPNNWTKRSKMLSGDLVQLELHEYTKNDDDEKTKYTDERTRNTISGIDKATAGLGRATSGLGRATPVFIKEHGRTYFLGYVAKKNSEEQTGMVMGEASLEHMPVEVLVEKVRDDSVPELADKGGNVIEVTKRQMVYRLVDPTKTKRDSPVEGGRLDLRGRPEEIADALYEVKEYYVGKKTEDVLVKSEIEAIFDKIQDEENLAYPRLLLGGTQTLDLGRGVVQAEITTANFVLLRMVDVGLAKNKKVNELLLHGKLGPTLHDNVPGGFIPLFVKKTDPPIWLDGVSGEGVEKAENGEEILDDYKNHTPGEGDDHELFLIGWYNRIALKRAIEGLNEAPDVPEELFVEKIVKKDSGETLIYIVDASGNFIKEVPATLEATAKWDVFVMDEMKEMIETIRKDPNAYPYKKSPCEDEQVQAESFLEFGYLSEKRKQDEDTFYNNNTVYDGGQTGKEILAESADLAYTDNENNENIHNTDDPSTNPDQFMNPDKASMNPDHQAISSYMQKTNNYASFSKTKEEKSKDDKPESKSNYNPDVDMEVKSKDDKPKSKSNYNPDVDMEVRLKGIDDDSIKKTTGGENSKTSEKDTLIVTKESKTGTNDDDDKDDDAKGGATLTIGKPNSNAFANAVHIRTAAQHSLLNSSYKKFLKKIFKRFFDSWKMLPTYLVKFVYYVYLGIAVIFRKIQAKIIEFIASPIETTRKTILDIGDFYAAAYLGVYDNLVGFYHTTIHTDIITQWHVSQEFSFKKHPTSFVMIFCIILCYFQTKVLLGRKAKGLDESDESDNFGATSNGSGFPRPVDPVATRGSSSHTCDSYSSIFTLQLDHSNEPNLYRRSISNFLYYGSTLGRIPFDLVTTTSSTFLRLARSLGMKKMEKRDRREKSGRKKNGRRGRDKEGRDRQSKKDDRKSRRRIEESVMDHSDMGRRIIAGGPDDLDRRDPYHDLDPTPQEHGDDLKEVSVSNYSDESDYQDEIDSEDEESKSLIDNEEERPGNSGHDHDEGAFDDDGVDDAFNDEVLGNNHLETNIVRSQGKDTTRSKATRQKDKAKRKETDTSASKVRLRSGLSTNNNPGFIMSIQDLKKVSGKLSREKRLKREKEVERASYHNHRGGVVLSRGSSKSSLSDGNYDVLSIASKNSLGSSLDAYAFDSFSHASSNHSYHSKLEPITEYAYCQSDRENEPSVRPDEAYFSQKFSDSSKFSPHGGSKGTISTRASTTRASASRCNLLTSDDCHDPQPRSGSLRSPIRIRQVSPGKGSPRKSSSGKDARSPGKNARSPGKDARSPSKDARSPGKGSPVEKKKKADHYIASPLKSSPRKALNSPSIQVSSPLKTYNARTQLSRGSRGSKCNISDDMASPSMFSRPPSSSFSGSSQTPRSQPSSSRGSSRDSELEEGWNIRPHRGWDIFAAFGWTSGQSKKEEEQKIAPTTLATSTSYWDSKDLLDRFDNLLQRADSIGGGNQKGSLTRGDKIGADRRMSRADSNSGTDGPIVQSNGSSKETVIIDHQLDRSVLMSSSCPTIIGDPFCGSKSSLASKSGADHGTGKNSSNVSKKASNGCEIRSNGVDEPTRSCSIGIYRSADSLQPISTTEKATCSSNMTNKSSITSSLNSAQHTQKDGAGLQRSAVRRDDQASDAILEDDFTEYLSCGSVGGLEECWGTADHQLPIRNIRSPKKTSINLSLKKYSPTKTNSPSNMSRGNSPSKFSRSSNSPCKLSNPSNSPSKLSRHSNSPSKLSRLSNSPSKISHGSRSPTKKESPRK